MDKVSSWLSRQSLPRILGLLFGNTRDLEARLADGVREIEALRTDVEWWRSQYRALTDTWLLSQGMKPTDPALVTPPAPINGAKPVMTERYEVEIEAEKAMEMLFYRPSEFQARIEELEHSKVPRDKEILRRVKIRFDALPEDNPDGGVVIGPAAIQ